MEALMPAALSVEELTVALERETTFAGQLRDALALQRAGVANDDVAAVLTGCDEISRLLLMLEESRRSRMAAVRRLTGSEEGSLAELEALLGDTAPQRLRAARERLRSVAAEAASEATINHTVLRRAVEAGDAFLQTLFSATMDPEPVYRSAERKDESAGAGWLLDRKA